VVFKILYCPLVLLCGCARLKRSQISALSGFGVFFSGIEPILAGFEFSDHRISLSPFVALSHAAARLFPRGRGDEVSYSQGHA
jgi:hypothetical protein